MMLIAVPEYLVWVMAAMFGLNALCVLIDILEWVAGKLGAGEESKQAESGK
jgi:hypothetical protein